MECSAVRRSSLCLATLLLAIGCSDGLLYEDVFTEVLTDCPETTDGPVLITINTDAPETYPYAVCYNEYVYDFIEIHPGSWKLEAVFNTDVYDEECMFKKQQQSDIYYFKVYVPIATDVFFGDEYAHLVNCSYETRPQEPSDSALKDSKKPVEQRMTNYGVLSDKDIKVTVVDYDGVEIKEKLRVGRFIKLHAELLGNTSDVESFQAVSCDVFSPPDIYYNIITGGCGDGTIVDRNKGFLTTGREAYSPLFRVFRVARTAPQLTFNCTFIICNDTCDGSSCTVTARRRRDSEAGSEPVGRYIQASLIAEVDPEIETKLDKIDVPKSSYIPIWKRVTSTAPPAVEIEYIDSEAMKDLQISLVLMVIVPVFCTLLAMLMTVYLLWVTLNTAYHYSQAKGREKLECMKEATEI